MSIEQTNDERITALQAACRMTLLFHSASPWDEVKSLEWSNLQAEIYHATNGKVAYSNEATTKVLCNAVRAALEP